MPPRTRASLARADRVPCRDTRAAAAQVLRELDEIHLIDVGLANNTTLSEFGTGYSGDACAYRVDCAAPFLLQPIAPDGRAYRRLRPMLTRAACTGGRYLPTPLTLCGAAQTSSHGGWVPWGDGGVYWRLIFLPTREARVALQLLQRVDFSCTFLWPDSRRTSARRDVKRT